MDLQQRIEDAIVAKFFEPTWAMTTQQTFDQQGTLRLELVPMQVQSEMSRVAAAIYDAAKDRIIARVLETLDVDQIVEEWGGRIAQDVVAKLQENNSNHWSATPTKTERQKMLDKVYEQVAEEFGRQCVERLRETGGLMAVLEAAPTDGTSS